MFAAPPPAPPPAMRDALDRLAARHPMLARIEAEAGPLPWRTRPAGFPGLLQTITAQQISSQAAAAIWLRLRTMPGALEPEGLRRLSDDALRAAGLSRAKIVSARDLAAAFLEGRLADAVLARMDDEAAVTAISAVRGLGRWSAEIHLLFALQREDVFPAGDLALAAAAARLGACAARPRPQALRALAEAWRPHRALAARLLWHFWRHATGRPAMDDFAVA